MAIGSPEGLWRETELADSISNPRLEQFQRTLDELVALYQRPEERRIGTYGERDLALVHNLGGYPGEMLSSITVLGSS